MTGIPYEQVYKSRLERAIERRSAEGEETTSLSPCYGSGTQLDVESYLAESERAEEIISYLDDLEKFVVFGYYILKKPQDVLAYIIELGDGRFTKFLRGCIYKIAAIILFGDLLQGDWMDSCCLDTFDNVLISKVILDFFKTRSFPLTAQKHNKHYVAVRVMLEKYAEVMAKETDLRKSALGEYLGFVVEFNSLSGKGYTGNLSKNRSIIKITDPQILASNTYKMEDPNIDMVLYSRAAFTQ